MDKIKEIFNEIPKEVTKGVSIALVIIFLFSAGNLVGVVSGAKKQLDKAASATTSADKDQGKEPTSATQAQTQSAPATQPSTQVTTQAPTQAPSEAPSQAPSEAPSQAPSEAPSQAPSEAPTQAPTGAPTAKEDIVKLYCDAYNNISQASSVTRTYDYTSNYNGIVNVGGNDKLKDLAGTLMNQFMVENTEATPSDHSSLPPVGSTTLNIDPALISNATCTDNGDHYIVTLYSTGTDDNYEIDSQPVTGSAGSFGPLLRAEDVSGAAGSMIKFEGLHSWYGTAEVTAKVDKATTRITEIEYKTPCVLHFDKVTALVVVSIENCEIGLLFNQRYTIAY